MCTKQCAQQAHFKLRRKLSPTGIDAQWRIKVTKLIKTCCKINVATASFILHQKLHFDNNLLISREYYYYFFFFHFSFLPYIEAFIILTYQDNVYSYKYTWIFPFLKCFTYSHVFKVFFKKSQCKILKLFISKMACTYKESYPVK